jgi:hypothetical protein
MTTARSFTRRPEADHGRHHAISSVYRARIARDASEIRSIKAELRRLQRQVSAEAPGLQSALACRRDHARARLIAYGLHRGVALERMEAGRFSLDQLPYRLPLLIRLAVEDAEREAAA